MTKEQKEKALAFLKDMQECTYGGVEEIRTAIEALEQEPSEDCVSRAELKKWLDMNFSFGGALRKLEMFDRIDKELPPVTPTQRWIPLVWDEYPTVDIDGNDDYVYAVDYSVPMPKEDEWVLITDENHNVVSVQYDGYDFGDYARENILAWQPLPQPYEEKRGNSDGSN